MIATDKNTKPLTTEERVQRLENKVCDMHNSINEIKDMLQNGDVKPKSTEMPVEHTQPIQKKDRLDEEFDGFIREIMEWFDFEKVEKTMKFFNWTWGETSVPSVDELKQGATEILTECYNECRKEMRNDDSKESYEWNVATGGFYAKVMIYMDDDTDEYTVRGSLKFVVSEWNTFD